MGLKRLKAVVINQHTHNFGDEAAYTGLVNFLSGQNVDIVATVLNVFKISEFDRENRFRGEVVAGRVSLLIEKFFAFLGCHNRLALLFSIYAIRKFRVVAGIVRNSDVVFVGPGGENIGVYRDWLYLFNVKVCLALRKTVIFPGNSFGPSGYSNFDWQALKTLSSCVVVAREEVSLDYLVSNGVQAYSGADCALLLERPPVIEHVEKDMAVFVPNQLWKWHPRFKCRQSELEGLCSEILEWLAGKYSKVTIVPQTFPYPSKDEDFSGFIPAHLKSSVEIIGNARPALQLEIMSRAACVVGMRYHSVVFGAMANANVLCLGYERKMLGFNRRYFGGRGYFDLTNDFVTRSDDLFKTNNFPKANSDALDESKRLIAFLLGGFLDVVRGC